MKIEVNIQNENDIINLQYAKELDLVRIDATKLMRGLLPQYLLRFAARALKPSGAFEVTATDSKNDMTFMGPTWPFQALVQVAAKCTDDLGVLEVCDIENRLLRFRRTKPTFETGPWTLGVIFSGSDAEREQLAACIASMRRQTQKQVGQILICGPNRLAHSLMAEFPDVEYLPYDEPNLGGRFLVGKKKNYLIRNAKNERVLICHSRIELLPGLLQSLPNHFDLITPAVYIDGRFGRLPYLDLIEVAMRDGDPCAFGNKPDLFYNRKIWLKKLRVCVPYIDGGLFCVRRSLAIECAMSNSIAWGEAEDVEWARRMLAHGRLVELSTDLGARSMTSKTPRYQRFGHNPFYRLMVQLKRLVTSE